MENLSSNLDSNLKLDNKGGVAVSSTSAAKNNLNDPEASMAAMATGAAFHRQSSQLHTPDVSSMSVEGGAGANSTHSRQIRNNLNKF